VLYIEEFECDVLAFKIRLLLSFRCKAGALRNSVFLQSVFLFVCLSPVCIAGDWSL